MTELWLDIETRARVDLRTCGVYAYTADPEFRILMCAFGLDDDEIQITTDIDEIHDLVQQAIPKTAHNAQFERLSFSASLGQRYWDPKDWRCTQAQAAEAGYPLKLEELAKKLGGEQKDSAGTRLINLFSKPNPRTGRFVTPEEKPEEWEQFKEYCIQDVVTMRDCSRKMPRLSEFEQQIWETDQRINDRGVLADLELAERAIESDDINLAGYHAELQTMLGITNANSIPQLKKGLEKINLRLPDLQKDTIDEVLRRDPGLTDQQRRALWLRQETALVASDKYRAAVRSANDDCRYRGGFFFFGAHTGRWSSKGVQIQNLAKLAFTRIDPQTEKEIHDEAMENAAILDLLLGHQADALTLKKLVRAMFLGPFTVVDYASIEARILAWWAGEKWAVDAFRANRDIYTETANRMGGLTRAQGKIAVLALGYNGSKGSLRNMGYGEGMSDEKVMELVYAWRRANPKIVRLWKLVETAFINGGRVGIVEFVKKGKDREIHLPSGRIMHYRNVRMGQGEHGPRILFDSRGRMADTYGGRLTENVVQAISRDILATALIRLDNEGYAPVIHVHDEAVLEGIHDIDLVAKLMCDVPWAEGLPLAAEGFHCERYRKG